MKPKNNNNNKPVIREINGIYIHPIDDLLMGNRIYHGADLALQLMDFLFGCTMTVYYETREELYTAIEIFKQKMTLKATAQIK